MKRLCFSILLTLSTLTGWADGTPKTSDYEQQRKFDYFYLEGLRLKALGDHTNAFNTFRHALLIDPESSAALFELSNYYFLRKEDSLAFEAIEKAIAYSPDSYDYRLFLANLYRSREKLNEAIAVYEALVTDFPLKLELHYYLSELYLRQRQFEKAIASLNAIEQDMGISEMLSMQKFSVYLYLNDETKAIGEIEKLMEKYPMEAKYPVVIGDHYLRDGRFDEALAYYERAGVINPVSSSYIIAMINYYDQQEDHEAAEKQISDAINNPKVDASLKKEIIRQYIQMLSAAQENLYVLSPLFASLLDQYPDDAELLLLHARWLQSRGRMKDATNQLKAIVTTFPENQEAWLRLINIRLNEGKFKEAVELSKQALDHHSELPELYFYLGATYMQLNNYPDALDTFRAGTAVIPEDNRPMLSTFWGQIGDLYHLMDDAESSYEAYDKSLQYNPGNILVLNNYAYFLSLAKHDLSKAEQMSLLTVQAEPENATYLDTYAWILFQRESYSLAKFYIENALQSDEINGEVVEHYGDILYKNGETERAVEQWKRALTLKKKEKNKDIQVLKHKIKRKTYIE